MLAMFFNKRIKKTIVSRTFTNGNLWASLARLSSPNTGFLCEIISGYYMQFVIEVINQVSIDCVGCHPPHLSLALYVSNEPILGTPINQITISI